MALTQTESAALMKDQTFIDRVKVCCLKFADYIWNEGSSTPGHAGRIRWSQQTTSNPDLAAQTVAPPTVMDAAVQAAGASIDDAALQSSVEATVNKLL